jgi:hypothetical protein
MANLDPLMHDPGLLALVRGVPGPYIIGATGGSGTRVIARIARAGGLYIGAKLNVSEDALDLGAFSDRWINSFRWDSPTPPEIENEMIEDLRTILGEHLRAMPAGATAWGWKEPRSSFLLPFFHSQLRSLRFLHVVRDGRDMAFSNNQNQLRKHGSTLVDDVPAGWSEPLRSIALWSRHNLRVAEYGEHHLQNRYSRVRFEDLCAAPSEVARRIYGFFELRSDPAGTAEAEVSTPSSVGRWREQDRATVDMLLQIAEPALTKFGY